MWSPPKLQPVNKYRRVKFHKNQETGTYLNCISFFVVFLDGYLGHSTESGQIGDWKSKIFNVGKLIEIVMYFQDKGMDR